MNDTPLVQTHQPKTYVAFELGRQLFAGQNRISLSTNIHHQRKGHIDNCNAAKSKNSRRRGPKGSPPPPLSGEAKENREFMRRQNQTNSQKMWR